MRLQRWFWGLGLMLCWSCATPSPPPPRHVPTPQTTPASVSQTSRYSTSAAVGGVLGGAAAQELDLELSAELSRRGDIAVADGALAATASWILGELAESRPLDQASSE